MLLPTTSLTGCMTSPSSECAWVRRIQLAPGDVVSRATLEEITAHNLKVQAFCR
jgi:hypothetical protein